MARRPEAFTLLELMTVLVIMAILGVMLLGVTDKIRAKIEKAGCMNNLKSLHIAVSGYMQQNAHWPQINPGLLEANKGKYIDLWVKAIEPFGASRETWLCPTVNRTTGKPDWKTPDTSRLDYIAMPFDSKQFTPFQWSTQPWFVEKGDLHGNGNLLIFPDGHIGELKELVPKQQ